MAGTCVLEPDINKCPNYNADAVSCSAANRACGFFRESVERKEEKTIYTRKTRWYEQYYKR
ncbi:MAG TPA: hypothetical protein DC053_12155 [Lachnoclostridium sp.]|nr:hypothetical protein [Lachnoclostridium sp.]